MDLEFVRVFAHSPWAYVLGSVFASIPAVIWFVDTLWLRRQTRREFHASEQWRLGKLVPKTPEQIEAARVAPRPVMPSYTPRLVLSALAIVALAGLVASAVTFIRQFIRAPLP